MEKIVERKWKDISGFEGRYQFDGEKIKSKSRMVNSGVGGRMTRERILTPQKMTHGYLYNMLYKKQKQTNISYHRLVWEYYNGAIPKHLEINHKNGIKTDNRIENLELITHKQNCSHRDNILDKHRRGQRSNTAKLTDSQAREIKKMLIEGDLTQESIAKKFSVSRATVSMINIKKTWVHI